MEGGKDKKGGRKRGEREGGGEEETLTLTVENDLPILEGLESTKMSNMLPAKAGNAASPRKCGEEDVLLTSQVSANMYFNLVPPVDASVQRLMLSASTEQPATLASPPCPKRKSY